MIRSGMPACGSQGVERHRCELQAPINLIEGSQGDSSAAATVALERPRAPERTFECAICYDEHPMEDCYISSMCGHRMCRDAAREVTLGAITCNSAAI